MGVLLRKKEKTEMKKLTIASLFIALTLSVTACGTTDASTASQDYVSGTEVSQTEPAAPETADSAENKTQGIDYKALVNKLNPLPDGWETSLETVTVKNSLGDDVEVEKKAYDAYLLLKADLEKDGVFVDLDSARRSVAEQQRIMDEFTEDYGADYAAKTVAQPGYSEHHTGLALDLYLNIDGEDVYLNEDMVEYPEIWAKIHDKLPEYGFILRYLEDKEYITGYGYEPWHIRYIDDVDAAKEITSKGLTFEEYLGTASTTNVTVDLGTSELYTEEELKEAAVQVKCKFAGFGCELKSIRYAGDECNTQEKIEWLNTIDKGAQYTSVAEFLTDFHTPENGTSVFEPDTDRKDYTWWLGKDEDGDWQLVTFGY